MIVAKQNKQVIDISSKDKQIAMLSHLIACMLLKQDARQIIITEAESKLANNLILDVLNNPKTGDIMLKLETSEPTKKGS